MYKAILSIVLVTLTSSLFAQFPEGFEGGQFPPSGWLVTDNGIGSEYYWQSSQTSLYGDQSAFVRWEDVDGDDMAEDWLISPQFTPTSEKYLLTFYQRQSYPGEYFSEYSLRVSLGTQTDLNEYVVIDEQYETDVPLDFQLYEVDLSNYIGQAIYLAFVMTNDDGDDWFIDQIDLKACKAPENLMTTNTQANGATLHWTDEGGPYDLEILISGEQPSGIPTFTAISTNSYEWTDGESLSAYDFYVRTACSNGVPSSWNGPFRFLTACSETTCDYQFETADSYGDDWNGAYIEIVQNGFTMGTVTQTDYDFGPFDYTFPLCSNEAFQLIWHAGNDDHECSFKFFDPWGQLHYSFGPNEAPEDNAIFYSNLADCTPVSCLFPENLSTSNSTYVGADLAWEERNNASEWELEIVEKGTMPTGIPSLINILSRNYTWDGGNSGTYYDFYVRSVCNANDRSGWAGPVSFTTLCNETLSTFPYLEDFNTTLPFPECWYTENLGVGDYNWQMLNDTHSDDPQISCPFEDKSQDVWLISPSFDFSNISQVSVLSFDWKTSYYWMVYPYNKGDLLLRISLDGGQSWSDPIWSEEMGDAFYSFDWQNTRLDLSDYQGSASVTFAFQYLAQAAASVYLDNFEIETNSPISAVSENGFDVATDIKVYPNPTRLLLHVEKPRGYSESCQFIIHDILGNIQVLKANRGMTGKTIQLDVSTLSSGLYMITIASDDYKKTVRFVKE